jgi:hypothetical protein
MFSRSDTARVEKIIGPCLVASYAVAIEGSTGFLRRRSESTHDYTSILSFKKVD